MVIVISLPLSKCKTTKKRTKPICNDQLFQHSRGTVTAYRRGVQRAAASCVCLGRGEATHLLANSIIRSGLPASIPEPTLPPLG